MSATATKIRGVVTTALGDQAVYSVLLDDSFAGTGEAIDLSADFTYIYAAQVGSVDAAADAAYKYFMVIPAQGVEVTNSNVLIAAAQAPSATGAAEASQQVLDNCNGVNLSTVGELIVRVVGKKRVTTSWA